MNILHAISKPDRASLQKPYKSFGSFTAKATVLMRVFVVQPQWLLRLIPWVPHAQWLHFSPLPSPVPRQPPSSLYTGCLLQLSAYLLSLSPCLLSAVTVAICLDHPILLYHFLFHWSLVAAQYYLSHRCTIWWITIFKCYFIVRYSPCFTIYPCSLFDTL